MEVILDNLRSAHNTGSIFRTSDATGIKKIYLCGITPEPVREFDEPRPQLVKVSLGAEKMVEWKKIKHTLPLINRLKNKGKVVIAIEQAPNSIPYHKFKIKKSDLDKIVLVFGSEVKGIPAKTLKRVDKILEIPMLGGKESLNVSVAFGIIAHHIRFGQK